MPKRVNQQAQQDSRKRPVFQEYVEKRKKELDAEGNFPRDGPTLAGRASKQIQKEITTARKATISKKKRAFDPRWEEAIQDAIYFKGRHPDISFRLLAAKFQPSYTTRVLCYTTIQRRYTGKCQSLLSNGGHAASRHLTDAQELGVMEILDRYQYIGTPLRLGLLRGVANRMLKDQVPRGIAVEDLPTVGRDWPKQFVERHKDEWKTLKLKFLDVQRKAAHKKEDISQWFELFEFIVDEWDLAPAQIWNMDETGFRIGVLEGLQLVLCRAEVRALYMDSPEKRTLVTSCETVSAAGESIPPGIIFPAKCHIPWMFPEDLPEDWMIGYSDKGYNTVELGIGWIQHFDKYTKRLLEPDNQKWRADVFDDLKDEKPVAEGEPENSRLLIIDGHESHVNVDFLKYAENNNIIVLALPPHLTHKMQPLDVGVFQSLKHAHQTVLDSWVRDIGSVFDKQQFIAKLPEIRQKGIKKATIISAWKKAGLVPFDPQKVLDGITELEPEKLRSIGIPVDRPKTPPMPHLDHEGYAISPDRLPVPYTEGYIDSSPLHVLPDSLRRYAKGTKYFNDFFKDHPEFEEQGIKFMRLTQAMQKDIVSGAEAVDALTQKARKQREAAAIGREGSHQKNWRLKSKGGWLKAGAGQSHFQGKDIKELQLQDVKRLKASKVEQKHVQEWEIEQEKETQEIASWYGIEEFVNADCMPHSDLRWLNESDIDQKEFDKRLETLREFYKGRMQDKLGIQEQQDRFTAEKHRIWEAQGRDKDGNLQWEEPMDLPPLVNQEPDILYPLGATDSEIEKYESSQQRYQQPVLEEPVPRSTPPAFEPPSDNLADLNLELLE